MFHIVDIFAKYLYAVLLSAAALIGLFVLPPVGILLLLYLRSFLKRQIYYA